MKNKNVLHPNSNLAKVNFHTKIHISLKLWEKFSFIITYFISKEILSNSRIRFKADYVN